MNTILMCCCRSQEAFP